MGFLGAGHIDEGLFGGSGFYDPRTMSGLTIAVGSRYSQSFDTSLTPPTTVRQLLDYNGNALDTLAQTNKIKQPQWDTSQSPYPGIFFDGDSTTTTSDWIECASNTALAAVDTMTFFLVISSGFTQAGSFRHIARKWNDAGSQGWMVQTDAATSSPGGLRLLVNNTPTVFSGASILNSGKVLLTGVINNGVTAAYVNGGSAVTGSYTVGTGVGNTSPLTIGSRDNGASAFRGYFFEYLQYNRVLSGGEIDTVRGGLNETLGVY